MRTGAVNVRSMSERKDGIDLAFDMSRKRNDPVLKLIYGAPKSETFEEIAVPLSPTSSIERAGRDVLKQQQKGMRCNIDPSTEPLDVYKDVVVQMMMKRKREKKLEKLEKAKQEMEENQDPSKKWWYTTSTVEKAMKDLLSLPFRDAADRFLYEIKMNDAVGMIIREMEHKFQLSRFQCESKNHRMQMMKFFVVEVRKLRDKMIRDAVRVRHLPFDQMPAELKEEFADLEVKPAKAKMDCHQLVPEIRKPNGGRFGDLVFQRELSNSEQFIPREYRISGDVRELTETRPSLKKTKAFLSRTQEYLDVEMSRPVSRCVTQPVSPRATTELKKGNLYQFRQRPVISLTQPVTPCRTRKGSPNERKSRAASRERIKKELSKEQQRQMLWEMGDPLPGRKLSDSVGPLGLIMSLGQMPVEYKRESAIQDETEDEPLQIVEPVHTKTDKQESVSSEKTEQVAPVKNVPHAVSATGYYGGISSSSEAMQFLLDQKIDTLNETQGDNLHNQLQMIWDSLGFKAAQKIKMVLRYSGDMEKSEKLSDAICYWQRVDMAFRRYIEAYKSAKAFLTVGYVETTTRDAKYDHHINEIRTYEKEIRDIADEIKHLFGDEVIIHGCPADAFLRERRAKLERLRLEK